MTVRSTLYRSNCSTSSLNCPTLPIFMARICVVNMPFIAESSGEVVSILQKEKIVSTGWETQEHGLVKKYDNPGQLQDRIPY